MKSLNQFFLDLAPLFEKGGKYERWYPLYEATDTFLFGCSLTTRTAPHVRDSIDFKRIMITVIIALIPCTVMGLWNTGYQANAALAQLGLEFPPGWRGLIMQGIGCDPNSVLSNLCHGALYFLPIYLVTLIAGSIWELVFNIIRGHEMSEAFLVTSLLFLSFFASNGSVVAGRPRYQFWGDFCKRGFWWRWAQFYESGTGLEGFYLFCLSCSNDRGYNLDRY